MIHARPIEAAERYMRRRIETVRVDLKRGLNHSATIASTAPLLGFAGGVLGMIASFLGCGCEKSTLFAAIAMSLAEALVPVALGLLIAIPVLWRRLYLNSRVDGFVTRRPTL